MGGNDLKYRTMVEELEQMTLSAKSSFDAGDIENFGWWVDTIFHKTCELEAFMITTEVGK